MANDRAATGTRDTSGSGYALLVAASPYGKQRLMDAAAALPQLAAVPPAALLGTPAGASVVQLVDPTDPQTVLTHLRTAAAHQGPVLVYLAGQLVFDTKQHLPHLALARTTPRTARYSALPWHWLAAELGQRPPETTTVLVDLVADETAWPRLSDPLLAGALGAGLTLYGTVAPALPKRQLAAPLYSKALAAALRGAATHPPFARLHERAAVEAGLDAGRAVLLGGTAPRGDTAPGGVPDAYGERTVLAPREPWPMPGPVRVPESGPEPGSDAVAVSVPGPAPEYGSERGSESDSARVREPAPERAAPGPAEPGSAEPASPVRDFVTPPRPSAPPLAVPLAAPVAAPAAAPAHGPHAAIFEAANAGRHSEAASMAAAWEAEALRATGPQSSEAIHWLEVRADLARIAESPVRACELWMAVADTRLGNREPADHPDVEAAVDRAHHQWQQVHDQGKARALAPGLLALRSKVPGRRPGALEDVQRRAETLRSTAPTR